MVPYATPEWVAAMGRVYRANPENENKTFKGMNVFLTFRITADPRFGIENDIHSGTHLKNGVLQDDSTLMSREDSERKADFILSATPSMWKKVIRKEQGFISAFMTGKIKLDKGSAPRLIGIASKSPAVVECFHQVDTEWPDEMSPQRLEEYRNQLQKTRQELGV